MTILVFVLSTPETSQKIIRTFFWRAPEFSRKIRDFFAQKLFFWRTLARCVLNPSPWPGAFLSLASRGFVLGKSVLGLGFFCVLSLGLDSTSDRYYPEHRIETVLINSSLPIFYLQYR